MAHNDRKNPDKLLTDRPRHRPPSELYETDRSRAQRIIDRLASFCGSLNFLILFIVFSTIYCGGNVVIWSFDPYPFQFYTFSVSVLAILMASILLLAANRKDEISAARAENAYHHVDEVNGKLDQTLQKLNAHDTLLLQQNEILAEQTKLAINQHSAMMESLARMEARQIGIEERQLRIEAAMSDNVTGHPEHTGDKKSLWQRMRRLNK